MLRGNWSSTMVSASAPSSLASQDDSPPAAALCHTSRKRRRTSASKSASFSYQRSRPASRQKARISAGVGSPADMTDSTGSRLSRGLFLVAELAAQDFADICLGQLGPELDQLGHLVGGEIVAAVFDDGLGRDVGVLLDHESLHRF